MNEGKAWGIFRCLCFEKCCLLLCWNHIHHKLCIILYGAWMSTRFIVNRKDRWTEVFFSIYSTYSNLTLMHWVKVNITYTEKCCVILVKRIRITLYLRWSCAKDVYVGTKHRHDQPASLYLYVFFLSSDIMLTGAVDKINTPCPQTAKSLVGIMAEHAHLVPFTLSDAPGQVDITSVA